MRTPGLFLLTSILLAPVPAPCQDMAPTPAQAEAPKVSPNPYVPAAQWYAAIEEGKQRSQVMAILDHLTNRIGPRLTSSDNFDVACRWAARQFEGFGLDKVELDRWGRFPVGFNRGGSSGEIVAPKELAGPLEFMTLAWSAGTKGRQQGPAVLVDVNGSAEDLAARKDLAGAWLVLDGNTRRMSRAATQLRDAAREAGALGFVMSAGSKYLRMYGRYQVSWEHLPDFPELRLVSADHKKIVDALKERKDGAPPIALAFDVRNLFKQGPIDVYNVIGEIRGTEKPDEVVIVGGHLDSWDVATGTTDNGTGASTTIEAARILSAIGAKPKRTIRFMLFGGEEEGLLGSSSYVKRNRQELAEKVSAVYVHDGGTNYVSGVGEAEPIHEHLVKIFAGFDAIDPEFPFSVRRGAGGLAGGSSDHASFQMIGIPGFFWSQKGRAVYTHGWHTQFDTFDLAIPEYQRQTATVVALAALATANYDELLPRKERGPSMGGFRPAPQPFDPKDPKLGVYTEDTAILAVIPATLAANSGIESGDVLLELCGKKVEEREDIASALEAWVKDGMPATKVVVKRKGERLELALRREPAAKQAVEADAGKQGDEKEKEGKDDDDGDGKPAPKRRRL
ncbi:MAG: M20/M25/M40 family metallo-hydrolase [Planctomycetota bacterium]